MLLGWRSPLHMRAGLPNSAMHEAEVFYEQYLEIMYGSPDRDDEDDSEPPWEAETIVGELT